MGVRVVLHEHLATTADRTVELAAAPVAGDAMRIDGERWRVLSREHVVSTGVEASLEVTIAREGSEA